jgi:putative two-component system response regulator
MPTSLRLLLVEDSPDDAALLSRQLTLGGYVPLIERVETEADLIAALDSADWDACIADYSLPSFGAMPALAIIRARDLDIPCIVLTGTVGEEKIVELMRAGANDVVFKSATARLLPALSRELADAAVRAARHAADIALQLSHVALKASHATLLASIDALVEGFVYLLDLRDKETEGHTRRVALMTVRLGRMLGVSNGELEDYRRGALLHDIGKMGVPDAILHKPGPLDDEERARMRMHPIYAVEALRSVPLLEEARKIPYCHHERWDGTGYPRGLAGEGIPLAARVFAVADTHDALASDRPYKAAWPVAKIVKEIKAGAGSSFDPKVVSAYCRGMKSGVLR